MLSAFIFGTYSSIISFRNSIEYKASVGESNSLGNKQYYVRNTLIPLSS